MTKIQQMQTHYEGCWRDVSHHECAIARIERLQRELAESHIELTQANKELKDPQGANRSFGQQLAAMKENRDYWYDKCLDAENKLASALQEMQAQSDEVQRDWLSPENTKGAQQRIDDLGTKRDHWLRKHCESERKAEGLESLAEALRRKARHAESGRDYWLKAHDELQRQLAQVEAQRDHCLREHDDLETKLLERAEEAEAALADCGSRGIYTDFDGPADAIMQMAARIEKLEDESMIEAEITGQEVVQALQAECQLRQEAETEAHILSKALDEQAQTVYTERQLRREAEQRAERAEALAQLVTPELPALLERLAVDARNAQGYAVGHWTAADDQIGADAEEARALAAHIREVLAQEAGSVKDS